MSVRRDRRTRHHPSSKILDVNHLFSLRTKDKTFNSTEELLSSVSSIDSKLSSTIDRIFEQKTLEEIVKSANNAVDKYGVADLAAISLDIIQFKYDKFPLVDNYKEVYAIFHDMNIEIDPLIKSYYVAPSYIHDDSLVSYICVDIVK